MTESEPMGPNGPLTWATREFLAVRDLRRERELVLPFWNDRIAECELEIEAAHAAELEELRAAGDAANPEFARERERCIAERDRVALERAHRQLSLEQARDREAELLAELEAAGVGRDASGELVLPRPEPTARASEAPIDTAHGASEAN